MAKKKTSKKKAKKKSTKKAKKKSTKKAKKKSTKKISTKTTPKQAAVTLAKFAGVEICQLCEEHPLRSLDDFERHLFEKHGGVTLDEYRKAYPKRKTKKGAFIVAPDIIEMDEAHRAMTHFAKYGKWPDWLDAKRPIDIGAADSALLRAFSSMMIEAHQDRVLGIIRYVNVALRREFDVHHAAEGSALSVELRANKGIGLINESVGVMHRMVDLIKKTEGLNSRPPGVGSKATFVAAATIEGADQEAGEGSPNRLQHQMTAVVGELHGMVQSFITEGPEHGEKPPSQVVEVDVEVVEPEKPEDDGGNGSV